MQQPYEQRVRPVFRLQDMSPEEREAMLGYLRAFGRIMARNSQRVYPRGRAPALPIQPRRSP